MICACLLVGLLFLRGDVRTLRSDSLASILYVNNWHQILASHSYFASFGRPSLLQHYWSLSVEEQFWPVMALMRPRVDVRWNATLLVLTQVAITLALAAASYRYVEMPIRRGSAWRTVTSWLDRCRPRQRLAAAVTTLLVAGGVIGVLALLPATAARSPFSGLQSATAATRPAQPQASTHARTGTAPPAPKAVPALRRPSAGTEAGLRATIVGDSVGETIDEVPQALAALTGIDQIVRLALAHGVREVIWLTLRESGNDAAAYHAINGIIEQAAHRWRQLKVADWNSYSDGRPWFSADDVHPSPDGAIALARYLRAYVDGG